MSPLGLGLVSSCQEHFGNPRDRRAQQFFPKEQMSEDERGDRPEEGEQEIGLRSQTVGDGEELIARLPIRIDIGVATRVTQEE